MPAGIELRDNATRNDQKNSDVELNRIKTLMGLEGIDVESLLTVDRYDTKLAAEFLTSLDARTSEQEFKKFKFDGYAIWPKVSKDQGC